MAPILGIFAVVIAAGLVVAGLILGIVLAVIGGRRRRPRLAWTGRIFAGIAVLAAVYLVSGDQILPLSIRARDIVNLPSVAKVLSVTTGEWSGDGSVTFKLPSNKPVSDWMGVVWSMNVDSDTPPPFKSVYDWTTGRADVELRDLSYDPATRTFTYQAQFES
jgi:hypothetical protein